MLTCPMCKKRLPGLDRACPHCKTDVSLLVDYVLELQDGLVRADALTKQGELGEAVWAYLEVLEVDPDNATARRQVGQVATAVRQFDRAARGRRWPARQRPGSRSAGAWPGPERRALLGWLLLLALAFGLGLLAGRHALPTPMAPVPATGAEPK